MIRSADLRRLGFLGPRRLGLRRLGLRGLGLRGLGLRGLGLRRLTPGALLIGGLSAIGACGTPPGPGDGSGGMPPAAGGVSSGGGAGSGASAGSGGLPSGGSGGADASGGSGGVSSGGGDGAGGGSGGMLLGPAMLSETGLFTSRDENGELVLAPDVKEFEPKYWLWSDGTDKKRYVYLPPGMQIDTADPDHWVFPAGTKFWKSFLVGTQLVETRLIEITGDGPDDVLYATYYWDPEDDTDATRLEWYGQKIDAADTTHDIPAGPLCQRCHDPIEEHVAGFGALQLNHDLPGVTLQSLLNDNLLTVPISTDIDFPGDDQATKDALGYLHANCGNCHNDSPGLSDSAVPPPQMFLRGSVEHTAFDQTDVYLTAINQAATASFDVGPGFEYRIMGGSTTDSAAHFRMGLRGIEDQMPPIGTEVADNAALDLLGTWIMSLPPP